MPTWIDTLAQLANLSGLPALIGLIVTASVIAVARDWRFGLWALLVQYILVSLLHLRLLPIELALVKLLAGVLVCPMLYWAARWVENERTYKAERERQEIGATRDEIPLPPISWPVRATNGAFRLLVVLLLGLALLTVSATLSLPFVAPDIGPACAWLGLTGLLTMVLTAEPLPAGMGLLTLVSGFELYFDVMDPGLVGVGVLSTITLLIGLGISYLTIVRDLTREVL